MASDRQGTLAVPFGMVGMLMADQLHSVTVADEASLSEMTGLVQHLI